MHAFARQLGLDQRVPFTRLLAHAMKLAALVDADLFVLRSYAENFGAVDAEPLICGLPVLISDRVNIHRELWAAGLARVVECSVDSITAGIESALAEPGARGRIATFGAAFAKPHDTWGAITPSLVGQHESGIARAGRRTSERP